MFAFSEGDSLNVFSIFLALQIEKICLPDASCNDAYTVLQF